MSADSNFVPDPNWPTIVELAIERWGQPNRKLSRSDDIRFGSNGSKSVRPSDNTWYDHEANEGGGYGEMHLATRGPLPQREQPQPKQQQPKPNGGNAQLPPWQNIGTIYHYHDASGGLVLDVVRTRTGTPRFVQRRPNGRTATGDVKWKWSVKDLPGHDCLLYRLPGLRASGDANVWITEGEKDADRLHNAGLVATTGIGGAGKWRDEYAEEFRGKHCIALQDNDQAGRDHVARVARSLSGIAASVKVLLLPGLPEKGDVSDWLDDNGTIEELERLGREAQEYRQKPPDPANHELPQVAWIDERLSDWADRDLPPRHWVVPDWIPRAQVTGLYGVGGIHKTNLLIQLLLAKSQGLIFLDYVLEAGPVYGLFCEDTREEIIRRASHIANDVWGLSLLDFPDFHFASLVGVRDKEFATFDKGLMQQPPTEALLHLNEKIVEIGATLVTLDTLPHFFGGNEVVRREVTQFVTQLDAISIARDCGMLFTAHPSARGRQTGSLESGSTGWEGSVRARLGLTDPGPEGGTEDDELTPQIASDRRILTRHKSNYAKAGETLDLVVKDGVFFLAGSPEAPSKLIPRGAERDAACDAKFLELLAAVEEQGSYVTESVHGRYAPKDFATRPSHGDFTKVEFTRAMRRLFQAKRIKVVLFGSPSRGQRKIIDAQAAGPDQARETTPNLPPEPPPPTEAEIDAEIARHLTLPEKLREADRRPTAKRLGMRVRVFEALVKATPPPGENSAENGHR